MALLLAAAQAGPPAPPNRAAMREAAARCGLPEDWLRFGHDEDGDYADRSHLHRDSPVPPEAEPCLMAWARGAHARIGLVAEPAPGPQTVATMADYIAIQVASRIGRQCGLSIEARTTNPDQGVLLARRHAPAAQIACVRAWLTAYGLAS